MVYLEYILVVSTGCDDDVSYSLQHVFSSAHATDDLKSGECHRRQLYQSLFCFAPLLIQYPEASKCFSCFVIFPASYVFLKHKPESAGSSVENRNSLA